MVYKLRLQVSEEEVDRESKNIKLYKEESVNEGCRWSKTQKHVNVFCVRPLRRCAAEVLSSSPPQFPPKKLSECSYLLTCFTVISQISLVELLAFSIYWIKIIEWYWWHIFFTSNELSSLGFVFLWTQRSKLLEISLVELGGHDLVG